MDHQHLGDREEGEEEAGEEVVEEVAAVEVQENNMLLDTMGHSDRDILGDKDLDFFCSAGGVRVMSPRRKSRYKERNPTPIINPAS